MTRSTGVIVSVKVPIKWESMTKRSQQRLRQIVGRDTRVIRAFLGIIEQHEQELLSGQKKTRINEGRLDQLTMTTQTSSGNHTNRSIVPHDFKTRFPRISQNELNECRQTATALYESYLQLRKKKRKVSRPCITNSSRRIPRWVFSRRFKLVESHASLSRWLLDLRDSLDSAITRRKIHDRLLIPLKVSPFHISQWNRGTVKALQIFTDMNQKWWVAFAVSVATPESISQRPPAVLGIDLGIEKAACTALVTPKKVSETRFFMQKDKISIIRKYDRLVAELQHESDIRRNDGEKADNVLKKLVKIRDKRENISKEYDRVLVREILNYISILSKQYTLYVAIGRLKNIRNTAQKGNLKGRRFRGMIHSWAFSRITISLRHGLAQMGWKVEGKSCQFQVVPEAWTSIICWKCGSKGIRPKQNYFRCPTCDNKTNADKNGAINIAGRLIMLTDSLHSVKGLGKWNDCVRTQKISRPKPGGSESQRKSSLLIRDQASGPQESAAIHHAQTSLLDFGDKIKMDDDDLAVVSTAEKLAVVGADVPTSEQEKETRSVGGIQSL